MSFSVWGQGQQLWEGATGTKTWLLIMMRRMKCPGQGVGTRWFLRSFSSQTILWFCESQVEIAGAISHLETILKLFKVREKATQMLSSDLQGSPLPLNGMYGFIPSSSNNWLGILLLSPKDGNGIFCLLDPERHRKLETLFVQPQDMGTHRALLLSKELLFLFSFSACVGSVCLMDFSQLATSLERLWVACTRLSVERWFFVTARK